MCTQQSCAGIAAGTTPDDGGGGTVDGGRYILYSLELTPMGACKVIDEPKNGGWALTQASPYDAYTQDLASSPGFPAFLAATQKKAESLVCEVT